MGKESSTPNKVLKNIILNMKLTLLLTLENVKKKQEPWLLEKVNVEGYKRKKKQMLITLHLKLNQASQKVQQVPCMHPGVLVVAVAGRTKFSLFVFSTS